MAEASRRLRVLVVSHATSMWGAERRILEVAQGLAARGADCTLACPPGAPLARAWRRAGLAVLPLEVPAHTGLRRPDGGRPGPFALTREAGVVGSSALRIRHLARTFDVVWSNSLNAHLEVALASRTGGVPAVLHLHDIVAPGAGRRVLSGAVRLAGRAIALTTAVADCVEGPARSLVTVVHNGVDARRFTPGPPDPSVLADLGGGSGRRLVGILGRIDPEKGIETVVRAVASLPGHIGAHLVVMGAPTTDRAYLASLRSTGETLLGERVRFVAPRDDVVPVLRALDVLVNASPAEPFGRTIIEAQACGVPVVAVRGGGVPEFVTDGVTGLLVPPGDHGAMAAALERVLTDAGLRSRLVSCARTHVERDLSLDRQVDATAAVLRDVARR
jgi:glycosyltransferase involved in cell wall biosynthesis